MIVGIENVTRDRESFDWWWPMHLAELAELVDVLCVRADPRHLTKIKRLLDASPLAGRYELKRQERKKFGKFQEDNERQRLLEWALATGAGYAVSFDADEVLEPGGGRALRTLLNGPAGASFRLFRFILTYSSHHRPGYVLPRGEIRPWRAFALDKLARNYLYQADADGLHCGTVPYPGVGSVSVPDLRVIHYHATSAAEFMEERAFYADTIEVARHGGLDWLYRCDRFGDESMAIPLEQELAGAAERLARVADGSGLAR